MGYDDFRAVKVMMVQHLQKRGWEIFGWKDDESDLMTDYYSPANWSGIATKAGFTLVVDDTYGSNSEREITKWSGTSQNQQDIEKLTNKIIALRRMNMVNNASASEEKTAKEKIALLENKLKDTKGKNQLVVIGKYPKYQPNPRGAKWHVEKDGNIYDKGTGLSKFSDLRWFTPGDSQRNIWREDYRTDEDFEAAKARVKKDYDDKMKLYDNFMKLIQRIDAAAGGTIGEGTMKKYQAVMKTKQIKSNITVKTDMPAWLKEGMCFKLNRSFNNGAYKGNVYQIQHVDRDSVRALKMDKKLVKCLTGMSSPGNFFNCRMKDFKKWVDLDIISMVKIQEETKEEQYQSYIVV